jgi:hypothetical protein
VHRRPTVPVRDDPGYRPAHRDRGRTCNPDKTCTPFEMRRLLIGNTPPLY